MQKKEEHWETGKKKMRKKMRGICKKRGNAERVKREMQKMEKGAR